MMFNKFIFVLIICFILIIQFNCSHSHHRKHLKKYRNEISRIYKEYEKFDRKIDWLYKKHKKHIRYKRHKKHIKNRKHRIKQHGEYHHSIRKKIYTNEIPSLIFNYEKDRMNNYSKRVSQTMNTFKKQSKKRKTSQFNSATLNLIPPSYLHNSRRIKSFSQNFFSSPQFIEKNTNLRPNREFDKLESFFSKHINNDLKNKNVKNELPKMIEHIQKPIKIQPEYLHILGSSNSKKDREFRVKVNVRNRFEKLSIENEEDLNILSKDLKAAEDELKQSIDNYFLDPTRDGKREKVNRLKRRIQFLSNKPANGYDVEEKLMKNYKNPIIISHDLLKKMKTTNTHYENLENKQINFRFSQKINKTQNISKFNKTNSTSKYYLFSNLSNSTNHTQIVNISSALSQNHKFNTSAIVLSRKDSKNDKILTQKKSTNTTNPSSSINLINVTLKRTNESNERKKLISKTFLVSKNISANINLKILTKKKSTNTTNQSSTINLINVTLKRSNESNERKKLISKTFSVSKNISAIINLKNISFNSSNHTDINDSLNDKIKINVIRSKMNKIYNKFNHILKKIKMNKQKLEQTIQDQYFLKSKNKDHSKKLNSTKLNVSTNKTLYNSSKLNETELKNEMNYKSENMTKFNSSHNASDFNIHSNDNNILFPTDNHLISSNFIEHNRKLGARNIGRNDEISILIKRYLDKSHKTN